jgi:hypothetical protein
MLFRLRTVDARSIKHLGCRSAPAPRDSRLVVNLAAKGMRFVLFVRHSYPAATRALEISSLLEKPTILLPRTEHGSGRGTGGKDENTRIEVLGLPVSGKISRAMKRRRKNRGMPPPATFDIETLPGSSNLTAFEVAAVIRRTPGALEQWRRDPDHPLKWRYVDGRPLYRVDAVRDYLARCDKTTKHPQPHNARGDDRAARP